MHNILKETIQNHANMLEKVKTEPLPKSKEIALKYCLYQIMRLQPVIHLEDDGVTDIKKIALLFGNRLSISPKAVGSKPFTITNDVDSWARAIEAIVKIREHGDD